MNGAHDLGGMHGLGPIDPEPGEPVFHAEWERRVFALNVAMGAWGRWTIDMGRHAREQMPPAEYLATSYYEHWLFGLDTLLVAHGFLTREEIEARVAGGSGWMPRRETSEARRGFTAGRSVPPLTADRVQDALRRGDRFRMDADVPLRFTPGDRVRTRNVHPTGHTRLPRYARGRVGIVHREHGVFVFADASGDGRGKIPQRLYSVRFTAQELWGPEASPRDAIYLDLWDPHLDPA